MKRFVRRIALAASVAVLMTGGLAATVVFSANPGTDQDPLVTVSFVEKRLQETVTSLTAQINDLKAKIGTQQSGSTSATPVATATGTAVFTDVQAEKGDFIYFGKSAEFVVRGGKPTAIATAAGGLADLTGAKDIMMNQTILANHHILVPMDDGRGIAIHERTWLLIKGPYTIAK